MKPVKPYVITIIIIILISLLFGIGRFFITGHALTGPGTYEAFVHIWSGFLLGIAIPEFIWVYNAARALFSKKTLPPMPGTRGVAGFSVLIISMIELYMFIHQGWFAATFK